MKAHVIFSLIAPDGGDAAAHTNAVTTALARVINEFAARGDSVTLSSYHSASAGLATGILDRFPGAQVMVILGSKSPELLAEVAKIGRPILVVTDTESPPGEEPVFPAYLEARVRDDDVAMAAATLLTNFANEVRAMLPQG